MRVCFPIANPEALTRIRLEATSSVLSTTEMLRAVDVGGVGAIEVDVHLHRGPLARQQPQPATFRGQHGRCRLGANCWWCLWVAVGYHMRTVPARLESSVAMLVGAVGWLGQHTCTMSTRSVPAVQS